MNRDNNRDQIDDAKDMIPALAYIRVSTKKQEEKETHVNQEEVINEYARVEGLYIAPGVYPADPNGGWFSDLGQSGISENRAGLLGLLNNSRGVKHLIFYDWSRIVRDQLYASYLLYEFKKSAFILHDASKRKKITLENEDEVFMQQLESYFAHKERKKIKERQKLGIKMFQKEFGRWGAPERDFKQKEIDDYKKYREMGVSKRAIARMFKMSINVLYRNIKKLQKNGILPEETLKNLKVNEKK